MSLASEFVLKCGGQERIRPFCPAVTRLVVLLVDLKFHRHVRGYALLAHRFRCDDHPFADFEINRRVIIPFVGYLVRRGGVGALDEVFGWREVVGTVEQRDTPGLMASGLLEEGFGYCLDEFVA